MIPFSDHFVMNHFPATLHTMRIERYVAAAGTRIDRTTVARSGQSKLADKGSRRVDNLPPAAAAAAAAAAAPDSASSTHFPLVQIKSRG
jgi:hypothetical protein